jgi:hypothetical protein
MIEVKAIANGFYGGKVRIPGEKFGINAPEDFSIEWMDSDDSKIIAHIRAKSKAKAGDDANRDEKRVIENRAARFKEWLDAKKNDDGDDGEADAPGGTRRVNTGGTDGVVGEIVKKEDGKKGKGKAKAEPTAVPAGSDNDDRSRDMAIDATANAAAPDWEAPVPAAD